MRVTPTAANVMEYAAIVRDRALLRRLGEAADEINSMVYEGLRRSGDDARSRGAAHIRAASGAQCRRTYAGVLDRAERV